MKTPLLTVPAALAAILIAAGCGSSSSSSTAASTAATTVTQAPAATAPAVSSGAVLSGSVAVSYKNIAIAPSALRVKVGTKITWTNYDSVEHNVTSESGPQSFASKGLGEGSKYSIVATHPGTIKYECSIHPASMQGSIEVVG